jgi:hypothetical protein
MGTFTEPCTEPGSSIIYFDSDDDYDEEDPDDDLDI